MKKLKNPKSERETVWMTKDERRTIKANAKQAKLSVSRFLVSRATNVE